MSAWRRLPRDAPAARPGPLDPAAIAATHVPPNHGVPNHPTFGALLYPGVLADDHDVERVKALFERNRWFRVWDWTVFDYHHFHPSSHEVLAVVRGHAAIRLGGAGGTTHDVETGDVLLLPAGFGHCRETASDDFTVVGAYPEGQEERQVVRADARAAAAAEDVVRGVALPATDPLYGADGPLPRVWEEQRVIARDRD